MIINTSRNLIFVFIACFTTIHFAMNPEVGGMPARFDMIVIWWKFMLLSDIFVISFNFSFLIIFIVFRTAIQ